MGGSIPAGRASRKPYNAAQAARNAATAAGRSHAIQRRTARSRSRRRTESMRTYIRPWNARGAARVGRARTAFDVASALRYDPVHEEAPSNGVPDAATVRAIHTRERRRSGQIAAIDPSSGDYAVAPDIFTAVQRARRMHPRTVFYLIRIGYRTVGGFHGAPRRIR